MSGLKMRNRIDPSYLIESFFSTSADPTDSVFIITDRIIFS